VSSSCQRWLDCRVREREQERTQNSLETVDYDTTERTLVTICEDFVEIAYLLRFGVANHVLRRDELDEGETGGHCDS